ncbi:MAG TPA: CDP-alcohol phosphatidyltransferase family protein, partial [Chromatiaceae bacterium]|nr:CDP-alcohol phosphatidyltransferase family protein [Chromatiaceae bacterium]
LAALAISIATGASMAVFADASWPLLLIPVVLFLRMALNAIDGMLAREHAMQSPLGAILNELGDVISDAALYLPFCWVGGLSPLLVISVVMVSIIAEMAGVVAIQVGASRRYDGPLGKSDRAFAFGLLALLIGAGIDPAFWANGLLGVMALLAAMTVINRARQALLEVA